jgi:hypothetical protein
VELTRVCCSKFTKCLFCQHWSTAAKRTGQIHNRGLRIALGAFCVCKITNILCESSLDLGNMLESTGCAIVMGQRKVKIRLAGQMSIFNAEAQA